MAELTTAPKRPHYIDVRLKLLSWLNLALSLAAIMDPTPPIAWWHAVLLLGIATFFGMKSYYAVVGLSLQSAFKEMPLSQRVWLDEWAHAAAVALVFLALQVIPTVYLVAQLVAFAASAVAALTGEQGGRDPLQRIGQRVGAGKDKKVSYVMRLYSAVEILLVFWLFGAAIGSIFAGGALAAFVAFAAYFLLNTCFGLAAFDEHLWAWGKLDRLLINAGDKLGPSVSNAVHKARPFFAKVQDFAKWIYPRTFFDRVTH
jgi:hypothetical protein